MQQTEKPKLIVSKDAIKIQYIGHDGSDERVVRAARVSTGSETVEMGEREQKLIRFLSKNQHFTPFEMIEVTFLVECPIFIARQFHRHRTFNYNEQSGRYSIVGEHFFIRDTFRKQDTNNKQGSVGEFTDRENAEIRNLMQIVTREQHKTYELILEMGVAKEQARTILGQNMMTKFYAKNDLRNWMHYCALRVDGHAQEEHRWVAMAVFKELLKMFPISVGALAKSMFNNDTLKYVGFNIHTCKTCKNEYHCGNSDCILACADKCQKCDYNGN